MANTTRIWRNLKMSNIIKPLAQVFKIPESYLEGVFLTKIHLYFTEKPFDNNQPPVFFDIRTVENGFPTKNVFPHSEIVKTVDQIQTNGTETEFELSRPIFLMSGKEYCFNIYSHSNEYFLQSARAEENNLDKTDPETQTSVPAFIASDNSFLFDPSNSGTYTPNFETGNKSLRYKLFIAKFDTTKTGEAYFTEPFCQLKKVRSNPITTLNNSTTVFVRVLNHGLTDDDEIEISGVVGNNTDGSELNGIPIEQLNTKHKVSLLPFPARNADIFQITTKDAANANSSRSGGNLVVCSRKLPFDTFEIVSDFINFKQTDLNFEYKSSEQNTGVLSGNFKTLTVNENQEELAATQVLKLNKILSNNSTKAVPSFILKSTLKTNVDHLSPVIDTDRLTFIGVNNRNNTKYITKEIALNDPAQRFRGFFSVNRPVGTDIKVYYRILLDTEADSKLLSDKEWQEIPLEIPFNNNQSIFNETSFLLTEQDLDLANSDEGFVKVALKVELIFTTKNFSKVPKMKNLRLIAST